MIVRNTSFSILSFVGFKLIDNWSVSHLLGQKIGFNRKYSSQPIGSFVTRSSTTINVQNDKQYKQVTLKTKGGGAVLRDIKKGKDIGTKKQFVVSEGQFIMSKIDARNGAFGVVPKELDGAIVTADFPVFDVVADVVNPEYFALVSSTNVFARFAQSCSRGTTNRQRIDIKLFLSQQIPTPSLHEQQTLVKVYNERIKQARELEEQASQIEKEIKEYLLIGLGLSTTKKESHLGLKFMRYKDVYVWGVSQLQSDYSHVSSLYPVKRIKDICAIGSGGTPSRSIPQYYLGNIPWIKTGEVINEVIFETEEHISQDAIENSSAKLYPSGSLIIAMYGQGNTRGRTAKMGIDATTNQACAVLYNINNSIINSDYLWYYLQGRYDDLRSLASGNNQPNLNAGKIGDFEVIIPPMSVQNEMVENVNKLKKQIKQLNQRSENLRKKALEEFEKEIFE